MSKFQERINYTIDSGRYVGYPVNIPAIIAEANSLEELEIRLKALYKIWIKTMSEIVEKESPFEFKQLSQQEWLKQ